MATDWSAFTPIGTPEEAAKPAPTATDWSSFKPVAEVAKPAAAEPGIISRVADSLKPKPGSELGYLGAALERGWNGLNLAVNGLKLSEYGELVNGIRKSYTPEQIAADPKLQEELRVREEGFARLAQENAQLSKANQAILESDRTRPETRQMLGVGTKDRGWIDSAADFGKAMVKDPGSVVDLALSSGPSSLASMATAAITYFGTRNPALAAAAGGAGSGYIEFGNEYSDNRAEGMSHDEAWKAAALKAGVVGALDAVSMNTAGKALNTVAEAMKSGATKTALKTVGTETAKQGALGGLGEAGGSLAAGKEVDPTNVLAEVVGEMVSAPVEAVSTRGKLATAITPEAQIAQAINENVASAQWVAPSQEVARDRLSPYSMEPTTQFVQDISPKPLDTSSITAAASVDDALAAAEGLAGTLNVEMPAPTAPIVAQAPDALEPLVPALEPLSLPGAAPVPPAVAGALPRLTERATDEDLLGRVMGQTPGLTAPRPQRIQGTPVANLTDKQLTTIANDESVPAITRRGASVELTARQAEAAPTIPANAALPGPTSPAVGQPVAQGGTAPALGGVALGAPELAQQPAAGPQPAGALDTPEGAAAVGLAQPLIPARTASARNVGKTINILKADLESELPVDPTTGEAPELDIQQYRGPLTEAQQAASALGRVMGKTVTFLSAAPGQLPNGLVVSGISTNDVYLANDTDAPVLGVAVHEITHLMPEPLKAKLNAGLRSLFNEKYLGEFAALRRLDLQNKALLDEEIPAYLAQAISERPDFWQDLRAKMGDGDFAEVARVILDKLNEFLAGTSREYGDAFLERYVTDVAKARDLLTTAYADAMKAQGLEPTTAQPSGVQRAQRTTEPVTGEGVSGAAEPAGPVTGESGRAEVPEYGTAREGAISVIGRHYSTQPQQSLSGVFYGRGLKGAERDRLDSSPDPRLKNRIYFYVDTGAGVRPESGVGGFAHEVRLNNIYDPQSKIVKPQANLNAFESAVINAGFDGYIAPFGTNQSAVVLLGLKHKAVPVAQLGRVAAAAPVEKAAPSVLKKGLMSKELNAIDTSRIPGAQLRSGNLEIPADQREAANAELKRIGSSALFSQRTGPVPVAANGDELTVGNTKFSAKQRYLVDIRTLTLRDLIGKRVIGIKADLTDAGTSYTGIDGSKLEFPVEMMGGPNYVRLPENAANNVVWAVRGGATLSKIMAKVKDSDYILVHAMNGNSHLTNATVSQAYIQTVEAYLRDKRITPKNLLALDAIVRSPANKNALPDFPGFEDPNILEYIDGLSFDQRGALAKILEKKEAQAHGLPNLERFRRETIDPEYAGYRQGDTLLVLQIDKENPTVKLGEEGTKLHPSYPLGLRGKVVGKLAKGVNYEMIYRDYFDKKVPSLGNKEAGAWYAFDRVIPIQEITPEIAASVGEGAYKNITSARQAQAALALANNQWLETGKTKATGGVSITEFVDALQANEGAAALTLYTAAEVKAGVKDESFKAYQLGTEGGDKGLQIFFGLKRGTPWYADMIDGVNEKEVEVVSVTNNERGAPGIASPAIILKAIQEGATILDAFAVKSKRFPDGFLPELYGQFGFETIGTIPFDASYYDENKMADLKSFWKSGGWNEADGYPDVVVMRWKGNDADRATAIDRYVRTGETGVPVGPDYFGTATGKPSQQRNPPRGAEGRAGRGDGGAAGGVQGAGNAAPVVRRAYSSFQEIAQLSDGELRSLGLNRESVDRLRDKLGDAVQAGAPAPTPESVFAGLDKRGLAKSRAETALSAREDADQIRFIQENFLDILSELDDSGRVKINCD